MAAAAAAVASQRMVRRSLHLQPSQLRYALAQRAAQSACPDFVNSTLSTSKAWTEQRLVIDQRDSRAFHSSKRFRASGDDSTIDFAYLPSSDSEADADAFLRVPIIPDNYATTENAPAEIPPAVMKPEISTMSADAVFLPMADLSDGHALNIDFHAMADRVAANLKSAKDVAPEEQASLIKQIWNDLVDDMIGARRKK